MHLQTAVRIFILSAWIGGGVVYSAALARGPITLELVAEQDYDSPDPLSPFDVRFIVHANGNLIQGLEVPLQLNFSNGNILGVMDEYPNGEAQVIWSPVCVSTFASRSFSSHFGENPTSPDTMRIGLISFGTSWQGSGEIFRIRVTPSDTGAITFDTLGPLLTGDFHKPTYFNPLGGVYPDGVLWNPTIHVPPQPGTVRFRISTSSGTDTLFFGVPGTIYFNVDAMGNEILGLDFGFKWVYSGVNFVGPFSDVSGGVQYSPTALAVYEHQTFGPYMPGGTNPDTSLVGLLDNGGNERFSGSSWMWSLTFQPIDTGTVVIDSNFTHPPSWVNIYALDYSVGPLPANFIPGRIVVLPCPYDNMGDVNFDALLSSSDLIYFVNYIFKSGPDPLPHRSVGDANCSGGLGSSDIIYLVNHIFKGGAPPCACIVRRI